MRLGSFRFWTVLSLIVFAAGGTRAVYSYVTAPDPFRQPPPFPTPNVGPSTVSGTERSPGLAPPPPTALLEDRRPASGVRRPGRTAKRFRGDDDQPYNSEPDPGLVRFYSQAYSTGSTDAPTPMPLRSTTHTNVLVLGIDSHGGGDKGRSDTLMVVSLSDLAGTVNVLSIPRDTLVFIPGYGYEKINAAHAFGGPAKSMETVQAILGVPVHHYILVDFEGAQKLIDVLGGVDIEVEKNMHYVDHSQKLAISLKKGPQHLNGFQAACYLRFRHDNFGDIGRVYRQQRFIKAVTEKLRRPETMLRLPQLITTGSQYIHTDMNALELSNLSFQALRAMQGRGSLPTTMVPGYATTRRASYWIMDRARTDQIVQELLIGDGVASDAGRRTPDAVLSSPDAGRRTPDAVYHPTVQVIVTRNDLRPYKALLAALDKAGYRVLGVRTEPPSSHPFTHLDSHEGPAIPEESQEIVRSQLLSLMGTDRVNIVEHTRQGSDYTVTCGEDFPGVRDQGSGIRDRLSVPGVQSSPATLPPASVPDNPVVVMPEKGIVIEEITPSATPEP